MRKQRLTFDINIYLGQKYFSRNEYVLPVWFKVRHKYMYYKHYKWSRMRISDKLEIIQVIGFYVFKKKNYPQKPSTLLLQVKN